MARVSRRALCAGLIAVPTATAIGGLPIPLSQPAAVGPALPPLIRRIVEVVSHHYGVPASAIFAKPSGPEVYAARRKALFLALSLSRRPANEIAAYLGIEGKWQPYILMSKAAEEVRQDPKGAETILELAAHVHRDAPAMLLGDIPAYDLEAA